MRPRSVCTTRAQVLTCVCAAPPPWGGHLEPEQVRPARLSSAPPPCHVPVPIPVPSAAVWFALRLPTGNRPCRSGLGPEPWREGPSAVPLFFTLLSQAGTRLSTAVREAFVTNQYTAPGGERTGNNQGSPGSWGRRPVTAAPLPPPAPEPTSRDGRGAWGGQEDGETEAGHREKEPGGGQADGEAANSPEEDDELRGPVQGAAGPLTRLSQGHRDNWGPQSRSPRPAAQGAERGARCPVPGQRLFSAPSSLLRAGPLTLPLHVNQSGPRETPWLPPPGHPSLDGTGSPERQLIGRDLDGAVAPITRKCR